jgi:DNA-binding beta-propeller fold protein YncE/predicted GH43/DUF377 family glycosyl hydrolase
MGRWTLLWTALVLAACETPVSVPDPGPCAVLPEGRFDYGEVGIGTCLSGPAGLAWSQDPYDAGRYWLVVANANPFLDFSSGSVLSVDPTELEGGDRVEVHTLEGGAVDVPDFAGGLAIVPEHEVALVTLKKSEGARTRSQNDAVQLVDLSTPWAPALSTAGPDGGSMLQAERDPGPVMYVPSTQRAYVVNTTSGSVSVLDTSGETLDWIDAVPRAYLGGERLLDRDQSGSMVTISDLAVVRASQITADTWTLSYVDGTYRIRVPGDAGLVRMESHGANSWNATAGGLELALADTSFENLSDPQTWNGGGGHRLAAVANGIIVSATLGDSLSDWMEDEEPLLSPSSGGWDAVLGGPMVVVAEGQEHLFYDGVDADGAGRIGRANSLDGGGFQGGDPLWEPGNIDAVRAADPFLVRDGSAGTWRLYFGAFDGTRWTIGHAESVDLVEWTVDESPVFSVEGQDCGAPVVAVAHSEFRLWASCGSADEWSLWSAVSVDGIRFTDLGPVLNLDVPFSEKPPGVGLQASPSGLWSVSGEVMGPTGLAFSGGHGLVSETLGWSIRLTAGAWLSGEGDFSRNGVSASSWLASEGLVYVDFLDEDGLSRIGVARLEGDRLVLEPGAIVVGETSSFDESGVFSPVVHAVDSGFEMFYAGTKDGVTRIGRSTSSDGLSWQTDHTPIFDVAAQGEPGWDSVSVVPGSLVVDGDDLQIWYTGSDGAESRIGVATSTADGEFLRQAGPEDDWSLEAGAPGEFDDSSVADPMVLEVLGDVHLWYSAFDGEIWSIGHAIQSDSGEWIRDTDATTGEVKAILTGVSGSFDAKGAQRPVVQWGDSPELFYTGVDGGVERVGFALGRSGSQFYRAPKNPTPGDDVLFVSHPGDDGKRTTIPLRRNLASSQVETGGGFVTNGQGVNALLLDPDRGLLYASSSYTNYLYALDVRDDSRPGTPDALHDLEGILIATNRLGAAGFRGMALGAEGNRIYALNDSPESVMVLRVSDLVDDAHADVVRDVVLGALPAPRADVDEGIETLATVGPGQVVRNGDYLYVTNFNANSVGVYDLRLGAYGQMVDEILLGENPYAMALHPEGHLLAVANYVGEAEGDRVSSTLALLDVDPTSDTFLEVLGWVVNK